MDTGSIITLEFRLQTSTLQVVVCFEILETARVLSFITLIWALCCTIAKLLVRDACLVFTGKFCLGVAATDLRVVEFEAAKATGVCFVTSI
jgi:hypothetical protein